MNKQKTILVTGINGLLGQYLSVRLSQPNICLHGLGKGECRLNNINKLTYHSVDIGNRQEVDKVMQEVKPHIIIHTAAMTNVDDCELQPHEAFHTNVEATQYLLQATKNIDIHQPHFIFISTDFIFKGDSGPYLEDALPDPVNYYGKTKLWGEFLLMQSGLMWSIVRTILVYGKPLSGARSNIVEWIKGKLESKTPLQMVSDQFRTPAYLPDLADGVARIAEQTALGIFNIGGKELITPYDIALQVAEFFGLDKSLISKADSNTFKQPAERPLKTGLPIDKAEKVVGYKPMSFKESLQDMYK